MKLLNKLLKALFTERTGVLTTQEEKWLAQSTDLVDLERRQRMLQRGQAPWHLQTNNNLKGWV